MNTIDKTEDGGLVRLATSLARSYEDEYNLTLSAAYDKALLDLQKYATTKAEQAELLMGDAIKLRMRQANGQWEKAESFIDSYQTVQKTEDPHGIMKRLGEASNV